MAAPDLNIEFNSPRLGIPSRHLRDAMIKPNKQKLNVPLPISACGEDIYHRIVLSP